MNKMRSWLLASRLHTLPLSLSGIFVGSSIAYIKGFFRFDIFTFATATAIALQLLSNFANDYGDYQKGSDTKRVGPKRALQSGILTTQQIRRAILMTILIVLTLIFILIYLAFDNYTDGYSLFFIGLGVLAIIAAIKYTVGKSPYGYRGLGDFFVFIFFGWVSVVGVFYLYAKTLHWTVFLPATAIGLLSVAVLNINNMRDYITDKACGKNTLVVKIGIPISKMYHYTLILGAMNSLMLYSFLSLHSWKRILYVLWFIPLIIHMIKVWRNTDSQKLNPELKKVALITFVIALTFGLGHIL